MSTKTPIPMAGPTRVANNIMTKDFAAITLYPALLFAFFQSCLNAITTVTTVEPKAVTLAAPNG